MSFAVAVPAPRPVRIPVREIIPWAVLVAIGGLFAAALAFVYGRFGAFSTRAYAAAFVAVVFVPFLKFPANPPGVGGSGTIGSRTELYFSLVGTSVVAAGLALYAARALTARLGGWTAALLGVAGYLAVVAVYAVVLPGVDEVPDGFPAALLWDFRLASLGNLAVLWTAIGVVFGALVQRFGRVGSSVPIAEGVAR